MWIRAAQTKKEQNAFATHHESWWQGVAWVNSSHKARTNKYLQLTIKWRIGQMTMLLATTHKYALQPSILEFGFKHPVYDSVHPELIAGWSNQVKVLIIDFCDNVWIGCFDETWWWHYSWLCATFLVGEYIFQYFEGEIYRTIDSLCAKLPIIRE